MEEELGLEGGPEAGPEAGLEAGLAAEPAGVGANEPECRICFNEETYECDNPDPFACIDEDIFDVDLPALRMNGITANLPYLNFRIIEADGFALRELVLRTEAEMTISMINIDYTVGSTPGPFTSPPFTITTPSGTQEVAAVGITELDPPVVLTPGEDALFLAYFRPEG